MSSKRALLGLTAAGVVVGHTIAYVLASADHAPGAHKYWPIAVAVAVVAGITASIRLTLPHLREASVAPTPVLPFAARLATLQVLLFVVMEVTERIAGGESAHGFLTSDLAWIGVGIQVLVAFTVALLTRLLGEVAGAIGRALRRRWVAPISLPLPRAVPALRPQVLVGSGSTRSPPPPLG
ncbi:MAG TPA: hypothetical protein VMP42_09790 [Actinomycetota bacterium]|nr:hypothetical protein [Actinomycetota bacterium]